jgi:hypothetical protein
VPARRYYVNAYVQSWLSGEDGPTPVTLEIESDALGSLTGAGELSIREVYRGHDNVPQLTDDEE